MYFYSGRVMHFWSGVDIEPAKVRAYELRGGKFETVSLWIETSDAVRKDRFTVEIDCPKAGKLAKAMVADTLVEVSGKLRHDRWKDKTTSRWSGKVYVAIEPGAGTLRSKGMASAPEKQTEAA